MFNLNPSLDATDLLPWGYQRNIFMVRMLIYMKGILPISASGLTLYVI